MPVTNRIVQDVVGVSDLTKRNVRVRVRDVVGFSDSPKRNVRKRVVDVVGFSDSPKRNVRKRVVDVIGIQDFRKPGVRTRDVIGVQDFVRRNTGKRVVDVVGVSDSTKRNVRVRVRDVIGIQDFRKPGVRTRDVVGVGDIGRVRIGNPWDKYATDAVQFDDTSKVKRGFHVVDKLEVHETGQQRTIKPANFSTRIWQKVEDRIRFSEVVARQARCFSTLGFTDSVTTQIKYPVVTLVKGTNVPQHLPRTSSFVPPSPPKVFRGIALPTATRKYPHFKTQFDLIKDSVITILLTKKGQRFFIPDFGSDLWSAVFEPNDLVLQALVDNTIRSALGRWEPRITVQNVRMAADEHILHIEITYIVLSSNTVMILPLQLSRESPAFVSATG